MIYFEKKRKKERKKIDLNIWEKFIYYIKFFINNILISLDLSVYNYLIDYEVNVSYV